MIGLTDGALARVAIGATAVPRRRRAAWLRAVACALEGCSPTASAARQPKTNAERSRDRRRRRRLKLDPISIDVDFVRLSEAMASAGLIQEWDIADREMVRQRLADVVGHWIDDQLGPVRDTS